MGNLGFGQMEQLCLCPDPVHLGPRTQPHTADPQCVGCKDHILCRNGSIHHPVFRRALECPLQITANKNAIPYDKEKPFVTSGLRLGTAATTTRGFCEEDMREIAKIISITLKDFENKQDEARARIAALCKKYPLYE